MGLRFICSRLLKQILGLVLDKSSDIQRWHFWTLRLICLSRLLWCQSVLILKHFNSAGFMLFFKNNERLVAAVLACFHFRGTWCVEVMVKIGSTNSNHSSSLPRKSKYSYLLRRYWSTPYSSQGRKKEIFKALTIRYKHIQTPPFSCEGQPI